jgi:TolB-like protein/DNA-binding winged helix-turn-helix (wHTH) protein/tetratricopeptide (TPR) repeat protein
LKIDRQQGFQLGEWSVYPDQGLLVGAKGEFHLEPKVMEVLIYLAERQDQVVRRDDLISDVWHGTFVTDEVLSRAISLLRTRLCDDRMTPYYIQTLPKVGYRLLMEVTPLAAPAPGQESKTESTLPMQRKSAIKLALAIGATIILVVTIAMWPEEKTVIDPRSPAAFASISEWFDYLAKEKEGAEDATSIAVLPFDNLSENNDSTYFSEGLTDELTMSLSKVKGLKVVARRSSYSFKNRTDDVPTIGALLHADAIFEGTIRRVGDQLRINAQLCAVSDGYLMWSGIFERNVNDVFDVQEEITTAVIEAMRDHFDDDNLQIPLVNQSPPDIEAYQLYLRSGNFLWQLRGEKPLRQAIELYRQALAIDPGFTRAAISLAKALVVLPFYSSEDMESMFQQAMEALAGQNFTDQRELGEVESIYGFISMKRWQWTKAEEHFRKALQLAPDSPNIYQWYSTMLSEVGRNRDGVEAAIRARGLDEVSPVLNNRLAVAYLWANDNLRAAEQFAIAAQLGFSNAINGGYMVFLLRQQRYHEFKAIMAALHRDAPNPPTWLIEHADTVFLPGNRDEALKMAMLAKNEGSFSTPSFEFGLWIAVGGIDQAYERFNAVRENHHQYLQMEFVFSEEGREFRQDSRFEQLTADIGLQEYWDIYGDPDTE